MLAPLIPPLDIEQSNGLIIVNFATNFTIFTTTSRLMARPRWIRQRELLNYFRLPVWTMGLEKYWGEGFEPLSQNILRLWRANGSEFTIQYLKECVRCVTWFIASTPWNGGSPSIRVSRSQLPLILPPILRRSVLSVKTDRSTHLDWLVLKVVLTTLSVYRVMGSIPNPKLGTITSPFDGLSKILENFEIDRVRSLMKIRGLPSIAEPYLISENAGPNYPKATWGSPLDAGGFIFEPLRLLDFTIIAIKTRSYALLGWLYMCIILVILVGPLLIILGIRRPVIGRLSKLYEAAGKVRIVAITDWWTQCLLRPLHLWLFSILRTIPQDGTFDQTAPLSHVLEHVRLTQGTLYSYDLSAATDRLPVQLQIQILSSFGITWSKSWASLLVNRPWYLEGKPVKYAVGQPMGALSSWAMLAMTHHFVVQVAAGRVGYKGWFPHYAVLGDDIVIADTQVALAYKTLMSTYLGVPINPVKGIVSPTCLEFAKKLHHIHHGDFSPFGPGVILVVIRNPRLLPLFFKEAFDKGVFLSPNALKDCIKTINLLRRKVPDQLMIMIEMLALGPFGSHFQRGQSSSFLESWTNSFGPVIRRDALQRVMSHLGHEAFDVYTRDHISLREDLENFSKKFFKFSILGTTSFQGILSFPLIVLGPGYWNYIRMHREKWDAHIASRHNEDILLSVNPVVGNDYDPSILDDMRKLAAVSGESLIMLDWHNRDKVADALEFQRKLYRIATVIPVTPDWVKKLQAKYALVPYQHERDD